MSNDEANREDCDEQLAVARSGAEGLRRSIGISSDRCSATRLLRPADTRQSTRHAIRPSNPARRARDLKTSKRAVEAGSGFRLLSDLDEADAQTHRSVGMRCQTPGAHAGSGRTPLRRPFAEPRLAAKRNSCLRNTASPPAKGPSAVRETESRPRCHVASCQLFTRTGSQRGLCDSRVSRTLRRTSCGSRSS